MKHILDPNFRRLHPKVFGNRYRRFEAQIVQVQDGLNGYLEAIHKEFDQQNPGYLAIQSRKTAHELSDNIQLFHTVAEKYYLSTSTTSAYLRSIFSPSSKEYQLRKEKNALMEKIESLFIQLTDLARQATHSPDFRRREILGNRFMRLEARLQQSSEGREIYARKVSRDTSQFAIKSRQAAKKLDANLKSFKRTSEALSMHTQTTSGYIGSFFPGTKGFKLRREKTRYLDKAENNFKKLTNLAHESMKHRK